MNIRQLALDMIGGVEVFMGKARRFFYSVALLGHRCPKCYGQLEMLAEGQCRCRGCGHTFDPTIAFQRCPDCDGPPVLIIRRYHCQCCGRELPSRFLFDALPFNAAYFREKMAESRQRKQQQREEIRQMLAEGRSVDLPLGAADLGSVPGLLDALNALTVGLHEPLPMELREQFDIRRYESHIQAHMRDFPVSLGQIPPLSEDPRKDLIWRFIAVIFLAHAGILDVRQQGHEIMVSKREIDRQRSGVLGKAEAVDGLEGSLGGTQAG